MLESSHDLRTPCHGKDSAAHEHITGHTLRARSRDALGIDGISEATLEKYSDAMQWIPAQGAECRELNPGLKCAEPPYEFVEYLDGEHRERGVRVRHSEAVVARGVESDNIKFRDIPEAKVLSLYHKGAYEKIGAAYAYIYQYAEDNGALTVV